MVTALSVPGVILILLGLWQGFDAIGMDVTVDGGDGSSVANLQAMQIQMMSLILACGMFVSGCILLSAGCIAHRIKPSD